MTSEQPPNNFNPELAHQQWLDGICWRFGEMLTLIILEKDSEVWEQARKRLLNSRKGKTVSKKPGIYMIDSKGRKIPVGSYQGEF